MQVSRRQPQSMKSMTPHPAWWTPSSNKSDKQEWMLMGIRWSFSRWISSRCWSRTKITCQLVTEQMSIPLGYLECATYFPKYAGYAVHFRADRKYRMRPYNEHGCNTKRAAKYVFLYEVWRENQSSTMHVGNGEQTSVTPRTTKEPRVLVSRTSFSVICLSVVVVLYL